MENTESIIKIVLVGSGKLAESIQKYLPENRTLTKWSFFNTSGNEKVIIIHAASGRELNECIEYCEKTKSILIELSTGSKIQNTPHGFPVFILPNTSLLLLKLMYILKNNGSLFKNNTIEIIESHQEAKTSMPGTALEFADSLHVNIDLIKSIRNKDTQRKIGIEEENLDLHAYHQIIISEEGSQLKIETKVDGHLSYVRGLDKILDLITKMNISNKTYLIDDIIDRI